MPIRVRIRTTRRGRYQVRCGHDACAVAVYEKSDGGTYVASMNIGIMGKVFGGAVDQTMSKVAADDRVILGFAE